MVPVNTDTHNKNDEGSVRLLESSKNGNDVQRDNWINYDLDDEDKLELSDED